MTRAAINPLQWCELQADGMELVPGCSQAEMLSEVHAAGFGAVTVDPLIGQGRLAYQRQLALFELDPAPGYFSAPLADLGAAHEARAQSFAALHSELGLTAACIADDLHPERTGTPPSQHAELSAELSERIVGSIERIARIWSEFGITACVHNHVGSYIESAAEIEHVLRNTEAALVGFCPDTGHISWAGVEPAAIIRAHRQRVQIVHVKDLDATVLSKGATRGWDYGAFVRAGLWREPGQGSIDLTASLEGLHGTHCWIIAEVDHSDLAPLESGRLCAQWIDTWAARHRDA